MDKEAFMTALDTIAVLYFNEEYDEKNPSLNASNRPLEEKRIMLYKLLNLGSAKYIHSKKTQMKRAFTNANNSERRISRNDKALNYKFKKHAPEVTRRI